MCICLLQDLRETIDKQSEQIKKLKKALKIYAKRLKSTEGKITGFIKSYVLLINVVVRKGLLICPVTRKGIDIIMVFRIQNTSSPFLLSHLYDKSPDYETSVDLWSDTIAMEHIPGLFYSSLLKSI